jgi:hypothetical protein
VKFQTASIELELFYPCNWGERGNAPTRQTLTAFKLQQVDRFPRSPRYDCGLRASAVLTPHNTVTLEWGSECYKRHKTQDIRHKGGVSRLITIFFLSPIQNFFLSFSFPVLENEKAFIPLILFWWCTLEYHLGGQSVDRFALVCEVWVAGSILGATPGAVCDACFIIFPVSTGCTLGKLFPPSHGYIGCSSFQCEKTVHSAVMTLVSFPFDLKIVVYYTG